MLTSHMSGQHSKDTKSDGNAEQHATAHAGGGVRSSWYRHYRWQVRSVAQTEHEAVVIFARAFPYGTNCSCYPREL